MGIQPATVNARDEASSEILSDNGGFGCSACMVVADLVTLISGSVYDSPTNTTTEITVGNTQFSFSYTSLFDDGIVTHPLVVAPTTITSPVQVWSVSAYSIVISWSVDGACLVSNGVHDQDFFGASVATSGDLDAQISAYQQVFANQLGSHDCQGSDSDSGITSITFPIQTIVTTQPLPQSIPSSTSVKPGSSIPAAVPSTQTSTTSDKLTSKESLSKQDSSSTISQASVLPTTQVTEVSLSSSLSSSLQESSFGTTDESSFATTNESSPPVTQPAKVSSRLQSSSSVTKSNALPTLTSSSTSSPHSEAKVGVVVGTLLGIIIVILLGLILWRLERKHNKATVGERKNRWSKEWIPWLQRKGELHADGRGKSELEARGMQSELEAEFVYEIPTEEQRHEMKSAECAQEMSISEKACDVDDGEYGVSSLPSQL